MRSRSWSRGVTANVVVLAAALTALIVTNFWIPQAFAVALAIGGLIGAVVVLYEVRLTKRIAQAEFIRLLNDGFLGDENTNVLWRKLLLGEPIGPGDRHRMSAYLTFFETLFVLMGRGVVDFGLVDNLFRNRFFRAIGDPGIQSVALLAERDSFENVNSLMKAWRVYLRSTGTRLPAGYFSYERARVSAEGFDLFPLEAIDLADLLALQGEVSAGLPNGAWLRENTPEMFADCLANQFVLGARRAGRLVAAGILVDSRADDENIQSHLTRDSALIEASCNLKLVLVSPDSRRFGLAKLIVELLEQEATRRGQTHILCTIHPRNQPSQRLFGNLGYRRRKRVSTSYGARAIFEFDLPIPRSTRQWADARSIVRPEPALPVATATTERAAVEHSIAS